MHNMSKDMSHTNWTMAKLASDELHLHLQNKLTDRHV